MQHHPGSWYLPWGVPLQKMLAVPMHPGVAAVGYHQPQGGAAAVQAANVGPTAAPPQTHPQQQQTHHQTYTHVTINNQLFIRISTLFHFLYVNFCFSFLFLVFCSALCVWGYAAGGIYGEVCVQIAKCMMHLASALAYAVIISLVVREVYLPPQCPHWPIADQNKPN